MPLPRLPPGSRGPGPSIPPPSWDSGPGNAPDPRISSRPAQVLPPPQRQKDGQGIVGERTVVMQRALPPPHAGGIDPLWLLPLRCGARGAAGTRDLGAGTGRERVGREGGEREREVSQGLADPGARHHMVLRQLDGLRQRRRAVALDPLGRSTG